MGDLFGGAPAELGAGEGVDVGLEPTIEAEGPLGSKLTLTADDIPELSDLQPGDSITFTLDEVTEDGSYGLTVAPAATEEPLPLEELAPEPGASGQEAVLDQFA